MKKILHHGHLSTNEKPSSGRFGDGRGLCFCEKLGSIINVGVRLNEPDPKVKIKQVEHRDKNLYNESTPTTLQRRPLCS
jgi:hypothetical protein